MDRAAARGAAEQHALATDRDEREERVQGSQSWPPASHPEKGQRPSVEAVLHHLMPRQVRRPHALARW